MLRCSANNRTFYRSKTKCSIWLDRQSANGTFSIEDYDPHFNIDEVLKVLEDEDVEEDKSC